MAINKQVTDLENQIKDIKKVKKELMPQITKFMVEHNISDLNTENGKLRCQARKTKQGFNKNNIRQNLSTYLTDQEKLEQAVQDLCTNREIVIKYTLKKLKN